MMKLVNTVLVIAVLVSGFSLYTLEHQTRGAEREIVKLNRAIGEAREAKKLLEAEWSSLTRPERIQKLAAENLMLVPTKAQQFVTVEDLRQRVPESVPVLLEQEGKDPIGDILEKMQ
jgi:cell division protein FtsL